MYKKKNVCAANTMKIRNTPAKLRSIQYRLFNIPAVMIISGGTKDEDNTHIVDHPSALSQSHLIMLQHAKSM